MPLNKQQRIVKSKDIKLVLTRGKREISKNFQFKAYFYRDPRPFRLLVIINKKISKKAVIRNKIRRRINAIFIYWKYKNLLPNSLDLSIIVNSTEIADSKSIDISAEIASNLKRLVEFSKKFNNQTKKAIVQSTNLPK